MRTCLTAMAGLLTILALAAQADAAAFHGSELAPQAKVSMAQARVKALKARPGSIVKEELEKEHGGSGLRYSFDIKKAGKTYEVGIDAKDGMILENGAEGADKD